MMDKKRSSPGTAKARLKDLCKEDKAKVGGLIDKLASEKKGKVSLEDKIQALEQEISILRSENSALFQDKERMRAKLEKCMDLMKELPRPVQVQKVDVYTQVFLEDDLGKSQVDGDFFTSTYDEKLFNLVERIENEDPNDIDPHLIKMVEDLEFSD